MATNKKITELTELAEVDLSDDDVLPIVDVSAGTTNKVRKSTLASALAGVASLAGTSPISVDTPTGSVTVSLTTVPITSGGTGATTVGDARTNLGLGSIATQDSSGVSITGGSVTGITDLAVADGGTGASDAATARSNLGAAASGANTDITSLAADIVISGSTSGDALRITQTGSGNALVVEDSANPDSTPFVVDASGNVDIGGDLTVPDENSYLVNSAVLPVSRPSLSFNFANSGVIDPRISFTRNSTATYFDSAGILQTAAANEGRLDHDPATGEPRGLLIENAATNLYTYSEQFDQQSVVRVSVVTNQATAPDGNVTADEIVEDATAAATHYVRQTFAKGAAAIAYTVSVYAKKNTRSYLQINVDDNVVGGADCLFDLAAGTAGTPTVYNFTSVSERIEDVGSGWYRCILSFTTTTATALNVDFRISDGTANGQYNGDGSSSIYVFGGSLETGAYPTSYIATTSSTVTRAADQPVFSDASWFNAAEGTFAAEFETGQTGATRRVISADASGSAPISNFVFIQNNDDTIRADIDLTAGAGDTANLNTGVAISANTVHKVASAYAEDDAALTVDGAAPTTDTSLDVDVPSTIDRLTLGHNVYAGYLNGHIRRVRYWPHRLSNTELTALTE